MLVSKLTGSESSEAKITSFIIDDEAVVEQPVINEEAGTIVFAVNEEVESLKFTPIIEISEGATITPASGVAQDFSNNKKVTYTVTAGRWHCESLYSFCGMQSQGY